jgi:hypothetical protein
MPFGGLLTMGIGGLASSLLGGAAGAANPRPPALNPAQTSSLNTLLAPGSNLSKLAFGQPQADPLQQALLFGQNAQSLTGANNQVTHALTSRGLGRSGLLGQALMQNANQSQTNQSGINLSLEQQAIQRQQQAWQQIAQLLNVNATPGQSGFGAFMNGLAPVAAYSIQNAINNPGQGNQVPGPVYSNPGDVFSAGTNAAGAAGAFG